MTPPQGRVPIRVILSVATALSFFSSFAAFYFVSTFTSKPAAFGLLLTLNIGYWYAWALLTPAILALTRRFPFDRARWKISIPIHIAGVIVAVSLHVAMAVATRMATYYVIGESLDSWRHEAQEMFILNFDWEMMTYWTIVGVGTAIRYMLEARAKELSAAQLETRLVEARLHTLQRQMQPHFLFNTLNTISALMHRDVEAADAMIARLSDLLRMSLQRVGVQEVALKEELDFLSKYLEIEQTRFRDRLTVVFDVQADTLDALVPNLLLQPLVENAIKHGIGPRPTPGQIAVRARINGAMLELDVQDNGVGLSAARLTDFNRGVGLSNTRSRLDHLYGSLHRFEFRQPAEGGLLVCIAIPMAELASEVDGEAEAVEAIA
ncbi:MAG TPA: sensor histidine kinase [Vicinamibacterales bacterium]|nr:sensor histidine kinase [Vicinamibacterales bacterium]